MMIKKKIVGKRKGSWKEYGLVETYLRFPFLRLGSFSKARTPFLRFDSLFGSV